MSWSRIDTISLSSNLSSRLLLSFYVGAEIRWLEIFILQRISRDCRGKVKLPLHTDNISEILGGMMRRLAGRNITIINGFVMLSAH